MKTKEELLETLKQAINDKSSDGLFEALSNLIENQTDSKAEQILQEALRVDDSNILKARGARQLTSAEKAFYNKIIDAMRSDNFRQAIDNIDTVLPETVIEDIFSETENEHPLLSKLDIQVASAKVKLLFGVAGDNKATWGKLTDKIVTEISGSFEEMDIYQLKVSAYVPIPESMLDLGPVYLDRFVRTLLYDALSNGIEDTVLNNLQSDKGPIGMMADLSKGTTNSGKTTYTAKTAKTVTNWTPKGLANVIKAMAKGRNGKARKVTGLFMVVSPDDYYGLVKPAICIQTPAGDWVEKSPYPIDIIQSVYCPTGKAIMGIDKKYMMGIGTAQAGKLETSDEFAFLDDNRTYKIKLYGNGQPKDNNAFQVLDITGLKELAFKVDSTTTVEGQVNTKAAA